MLIYIYILCKLTTNLFRWKFTENSPCELLDWGYHLRVNLFRKYLCLSCKTSCTIFWMVIPTKIQLSIFIFFLGEMRLEPIFEWRALSPKEPMETKEDSGSGTGWGLVCWNRTSQYEVRTVPRLQVAYSHVNRMIRYCQPVSRTRIFQKKCWNKSQGAYFWTVPGTTNKDCKDQYLHMFHMFWGNLNVAWSCHPKQVLTSYQNDPLPAPYFQSVGSFFVLLGSVRCERSLSIIFMGI